MVMAVCDLRFPDLRKRIATTKVVELDPAAELPLPELPDTVPNADEYVGIAFFDLARSWVGR